MWFKLASATFSTHLGSMAELSNSIKISYTGLNNAFTISKSSVSKDDTTAELTLTLNSGWTCTSASATVTGASETSDSYSNGVLTINITPSSGTTFGDSGATEIVINVTHDATGGSVEDDPIVPPAGDPEIGTTTTFGSTNVEVTIIGKFSDFNFANKCVISTSSGSSCSLNTAGASGRISSPNQVLKVSGGEAVTFNSSISGLQYALIEFTDKPCTVSTLNKSGQYGQAWTTEASMTLHSNTKYLGINFNNGNADMTSEQLESLKTAIVLS